MTGAPERIWHSADRRGKISGSPDAHVKPCDTVRGAYVEYIRADTHDALVKAADEMAEALKSALDYASDASKGYLWHETKKDGHDALARLSADIGKDDIETFNAALTAYRKARGETQ